MQDLIVSVQRLTPSTIEFDLVGVDASIANALRRVMIAEVSRPGSDHRPLLTPGPHHGHRPNLRLEQHLDHFASYSNGYDLDTDGVDEVAATGLVLNGGGAHSQLGDSSSRSRNGAPACVNDATRTDK